MFARNIGELTAEIDLLRAGLSNILCSRVQDRRLLRTVGCKSARRKPRLAFLCLRRFRGAIINDRLMVSR